MIGFGAAKCSWNRGRWKSEAIILSFDSIGTELGLAFCQVVQKQVVPY